MSTQRARHQKDKYSIRIRMLAMDKVTKEGVDSIEIEVDMRMEAVERISQGAASAMGRISTSR
jgi:hypothetical protein